MKTIINHKNNSTTTTTDNVKIEVSEDEGRIYIRIVENQYKDLSHSETEEVETNYITIPKARELGLQLD